MTTAQPLASGTRRMVLLAIVACAMLVVSTAVFTEGASAHGNCTIDGLAPYKSPSGAQIRGTGVISCDNRHETVRACAAVEKLTPAGWEPFGDVKTCKTNADAFSATARDARPCAQSGSYRTEVKVRAVGANGVVHSAGLIRGPVTIVCNPSDLLSTNVDDLLWLAG